MLLARFGVLGIVGVLLILVWAVGFVLGLHDGYWHLLFLLGVLSCVVQAVRRVAA